MSKTSSAVVCETNQILGKNQENVYFHSLFRLPEEFGSSYVRSAKSTAPIQICALFSAQGEDTLAAMTLQAVLAKMQEITAATQQMSVLDYENFTSQVVNVLNTTVCNESLKHNGANIRVSMSMVIIEGDTLRVMNIGNTHIWMFRQGKLISLTENQTVAHRYVQMGAIPKEAEYTHEGRNELTQYLGRFAQDGEVLPDKKVHLKLMDGDELVMIGTGLDQEVPIQKLGVIIARPTQPETKASELVSYAMQQGVKAGLTALVVRIESTLLLPGDAKIEESAVTNDLSVASRPVVAATPVAPVSQAQQPAPVSDAPTIQSDELRFRMNQQFQEPPIPAFGDEEDLEDDEEESAPVRVSAKEKKKKNEKKGSALKNVLIGLLIFLICGVVGYVGMYVLFNIAHWNGDLKPVETSEQSDEELDQVMYALYDDTSLYVEESLDSQVIDTLERGEAITLLASNGNFAKIRKENGLIGYVPLDMISEEDPTIGETKESEFIDPTPIPTTPTEITKATSKKEETEPTSEPSDTTSEITPPESSSEETSAPESSSETSPESSESSESSETPAPSSEESSSEPSSESSSESPEETSSDTEAPSSETEAPADPA